MLFNKVLGKNDVSFILLKNQRNFLANPIIWIFISFALGNMSEK